MAKKTMYSKRKKREKDRQIDHIPKHSQQRRSRGGSKRRTDFSPFCFSSSSSLSNSPFVRDPWLESCGSKEILSSITTGSLEETKERRMEMYKLPLVRLNKSQDDRLVSISNFVEVPVEEVAPVGQTEFIEAWTNRDIDKQRSETVRMLEFNPNQSQITESVDVCITPGSVVWAKAARQLWWPAEILGERSTSVDSNNESTDGHVLAHYYGNNESAWVDPAGDLSQFEDKEHLSLCGTLIGSLDRPNCLNLQDQSPDKCISPSSSRTESDNLGLGRSRRERKPKVHFDEVTFPLKSARKIRRLKIMRFLGLAAPVGSPFSLTPYVRNASK